MSKVKILGVLAGLGALVLAAYLAPHFIDQSSLRAWIAPELQRVLRQGVAIDGPIDFAILPRPMVRARTVRVSQGDRQTAEIPEIEAELQFLPLLQGRLEPQRLVLSRPVLHLDAPSLPVAAAASSAAPTAGQSAARPASGATGAPRISGRVDIEQGTLILPALTLSPVDLKITAGDNTLTVAGRVVAGRVGLRVDGDAHWDEGLLRASTVALRFDGGAVLRWSGQGDPLSADHPLTGKLSGRLDDPAALLGQEITSPPLGLAADITARPGEIDAANLVVNAGDADFRGDGRYIAGETPRAAFHLHTATLDLARMAPAPVQPAATASVAPPVPPLPAGAAPEPSRPKPLLPFLDGVSVELGLTADQILWRGKILQDAKLDLTAEKGMVTVRQGAVTLPGNSQVSLIGSLGEGPRLDGSFDARSDDLRALLRWADLDPARVPGDRLRAARLSGRISGDFEQISLDSVRLKIDSSQIDLSATVRPGPHPALGLTFALDSLNGDAYWPAAAPAPAPGPVAASGPESAGLAVPESTASREPSLEAEIKGRIGHLVWRGQTVNDVSLDAALNGADIAVHRLSVGDLAGAEASVSGTVTRADGGYRIERGKAELHSREIGRTLRALGVDLPLVGQADLSADLSGAWAQPAMVITAPVLTFKRTWLDHVSVNLSLPPGRTVFDHLAAGLYGGQLSGEGSLAHDGGASTLHLALAGAQMRKALLEVADVGLADGDLSAEVQLASSGKPSEFEANLSGTGTLAVKNGQIRGFDLKAANDRLKGQQGLGSLLALLQAGLTGGETRFSSLSGTAKADRGVIVSNDLALVAEGGGATGTATVNLPANTIDAHADFRFANAQDAPPLTMRLSGSLQSPHRTLDVKPLQQWLNEHGVKTGKPKDVLKGLLQGLVH